MVAFDRPYSKGEPPGPFNRETSGKEPRRLIGFWRDEQHPNCPDPQSLIDSTWDADERHAVGAYPRFGTVVIAYMGTAQCRLCRQDNSALEFTDGVYQWPEGLAHYVSELSVRLPDEFENHVAQRLNAFEVHSPSIDWWLVQTRPR